MVAIILTEALFGASLCTDFNGVFGSNYLRCPCFSSGFSISETPTLEISLGKKRVKKQKRNAGSIVVSCGLDNVINREELEFKPSFDEYLKAMESVKEKKQRDSVRRKKSEEKGKFVKSEKEKCVESSDFVELNEKYEGVGVVKESGGGGGKLEFRMVKNQKRQSISKDKNVDEMVSMEREAFKTMDGDVYDKPRVTKAEMEERIQKLAKW